VAASVGLLLAAGPVVSLPAPAAAAPDRQWQLTAPGDQDQPVTATVRLDTAGRLTLEVRRGTTAVLEPSALGIRTTAADLTAGLAFATRSDRRVTERYTTAAGRRREHVADANQTTLRFTRGSARLDLVVRVSPDGVGYRYVLPQRGQVVVTGEASEFAVPGSARAYLLPYDNGRNDYESIHVHTTVGQAAPAGYGYPSLFRVGESWLLVTESDVSGRYGASRLTLDGQTRRFGLTLPDARVTATGPLATPWRTMVVGSLATVTESDLVTDLAPPSRVADASWIRPGRAAWSWWSDGPSSRSLAAQQRYVDYASRMGWEYVLVDAGWSASWMPELAAYARQRGVGIMAWVHWTGLDTAAERDSKLPLWRSWGIAGLKIDFMESDGQERMRWYDEILAATARHHLLLNFHGGTVPRGTERTWPQLMTSEAVRGAEGIKPRPGRQPYPVTHYTTLPFTRNLAGSMDFTPVTFSAVRSISDGAELALSVVFESGVQNFADSIDTYAAYPLAERFLRAVPSAWDDTRLISGDPESHVVLARKRGTDWFAGAVMAGPARTVTVPLGFLGGTTWLAEIYQDGADGRLGYRSERVGPADTLSVPVADHGGFAVRFCPAPAGATGCPDGTAATSRPVPERRPR
jgi:alpha-glucosidase